MDKYKGKRTAILGLGMEGLDAADYIGKFGAEITIFDKKEKKDLDLKKVKGKYNLVCGKNYLKDGLEGFDLIVRSPGVYRYIPEIVDAEKKGAEVTSAIKIFFENCQSRIIGVTGTKGKGTTSSLIYEILKEDKKEVYLAGNIGKPMLSLLEKINKDSIVVLEMSSFQLIDMEKSPNLAVVLNITLDHMDWHKSESEYINAKKNIVRYQKNNDFSVINFDFETSRDFEKLTKGRVYFFSKENKVKGCFVDGDKIVLNVNEKMEVLGSVDKLLLRGRHNWENVLAAVCTSSLAGAKLSSIKSALYSFKGLEHRLELVKIVKGIGYYNDSFATGPQPTIAAIKSFNEPITLILGGYDKGLDFEKMYEEIVGRNNIKNIILIGNLSSKFEKDLKNKKFKGQIYNIGKSSMDDVVKFANKTTPEGGVVLLSPAAASFDMFESYKDRGNKFKEAVQNLK